MTLKLITSSDTLRLNGESYELQVMLECLDTLFPEEKANNQYLSKATIQKIKDQLAAGYHIFYFVDSYTYAVKDYHDNDGDYINSDSETNTYPAPMAEMVAELTKMGYNDATKMIKDATIVFHDINLYYGERISLKSYCIKI